MSTPNKEAGMQTCAWLYTGRLGHVQAFTSEPPPSMRAEPNCESLVRRADAEAVILDLRQNLEMARNIAKAEQEENESLRADAARWREILADQMLLDRMGYDGNPKAFTARVDENIVRRAALAGAKPEQ